MSLEPRFKDTCGEAPKLKIPFISQRLQYSAYALEFVQLSEPHEHGGGLVQDLCLWY